MKNKEKIMYCNNEEIKTILSTRDTTYNNILQHPHYYDDEQLKKIKRLTLLEKWEWDLLYIASQYNAKKVCELYCISPSFVSVQLKRIKNKLK